MQRGGHIDRAGVPLSAGEMHVFRLHVGTDSTQELTQGRSGPFPDRAPPLDADESGNLGFLRERVEAIEGPGLLIVHQTTNHQSVAFIVDVGRLVLPIVRVERKRVGYRGFWVGGGEAIRVEQPSLYLIVEARDCSQRVLRGVAISDVATSEK